ncbi:MoaD/ThiS family protein [Gordonia alkaliphila]|uniref:MoaD/ThiS family protein n=1 Tax=Gordonia alkaliphila TaxID=1053547 RepID=A0ABP8Z9V5_9ACTN|nr:MoaD/ThiS family protein [Gordonia alkaliphila]MCK0440245.1 MoaD/ThiS family protein [Gordonia alkaliphila]
MAETITVNYFAGLVDRTGCAREQFALDTLTVGALRAAVAERHGSATGELVDHCSVLDGDDLLRDDAAAIGTEVDLLPPFAGG